MPKALSPQQVEQYRSRGYVAPLPAVSAARAAEILARLEAQERAEGGRLSLRPNRRPHLLLVCLVDFIRHPRILDGVEDVIGPDILCWGSSFFAKNAHDPAFVSWHQDATYWGLSRPDVVTAWVALTPSTRASGCMRAIPGSHLADQRPHRDTFAPDNLLSRGQEVAVAVDEARAVDIELQPGEMSLRDVELVHGSEPNRAGHRRVGFAIRYISTAVRQVAGTVDSATLVSGRDAYGHFLPEPRPARDFDPEAAAFHARMFDAGNQVSYREAAQVPAEAAPPR
ncbi:MAG: phytanoyl-CoA dioxygenase family protein [Rhodospirillaceae bacterium]|nr:phytanoyl-CoA dioxygenase family protein [Rhodospirillaceae bacterium]